jgi:hypothetical protein
MLAIRNLQRIHHSKRIDHKQPKLNFSRPWRGCCRRRRRGRCCRRRRRRPARRPPRTPPPRTACSPSSPSRPSPQRGTKQTSITSPQTDSCTRAFLVKFLVNQELSIEKNTQSTIPRISRDRFGRNGSKCRRIEPIRPKLHPTTPGNE